MSYLNRRPGGGGIREKRLGNLKARGRNSECRDRNKNRLLGNAMYVWTSRGDSYSPLLFP